MIEMLAAADGPWPWVLFGRFHPLTVHFPIALLLLAAGIEAWFLLHRKPAAGQASLVCCLVGTLGALVSTVMGYSFANEASASETLRLHERLGLVTCAMTSLTSTLVIWARRAGGVGGAAMIFRGFLFLSAMSVSVTAHFGGEMVYPNWLIDHMPWDPDRNKPLQTSSEAPPVDFEKEIAPMIKDSCLKCHGPKKMKGKLRLDTKELAMKKGIKPGRPNDSTFYTLLLSKDPDERMPSEAEPLPPAQIELVRRWIEQGAIWPDGVEIK
jgi:uncharacterized membrane protein